MCKRGCVHTYCRSKGDTFFFESGGKVIKINKISKYLGDVEVITFTDDILVIKELHAIDDLIVRHTVDRLSEEICEFVRSNLNNMEIPSSTINNRRNSTWNKGRLKTVYGKPIRSHVSKHSAYGKPGTFIYLNNPIGVVECNV